MATNAVAPPVNLQQISASMYEDELDELDAMVERVRALGGKYSTRTRLLRVAVKRLMTLEPTQIVEELEKLPATRTQSR